ncbi:TPA: AmiS/UreI transporter [Burkholderia aenigmatica]|uniref:AmiS/UreI family transporter n=1 Tax=Burkholderia sp. AU45251 TaxID=3059204 RepID=UPI0026550DB2|nr:AmiS/UreI family transporter [Burkholderia sp. AU45251]HDR9481725.1 AmiS/UreI transporter [Burkholderia aenigmatica]MDN7513649.1 AmiS/UreI family transporter [Burkholderia sp. AU45251]HDR9513252.1 AmiS/UreI transporter [Burkholderia aenigmatica]HDR9590096.1 AmiS/UreI transporter [Burkholderia aenigmatica]HDR9597899.1 AmiS/UreI transporter [Burkholderia aenigmatica]
MLGVALFFIGAVLVVNGVALTGRIEPRDAAGLNLLVGLLALLINLVGLVQASEPPQYFSSAGGLLFAFTYLYLAAVQWRGLQGAGLGWYCLFVAISALVYAGTSHDVRFGAMWLLWSSLWFLFFVALGLKRRVRFLPGYTIAIGVGTCWLPGMLMMTGRW